MSDLRVTDEEWEEWLEFLNKYNKQKEDKRQMVRESFLYGLYQSIKSNCLRCFDDGK